MRSETFSEQEASWQLPTHEANICCDVTQVEQRICVASVNPVALYVLEKVLDKRASVIDLTALFPTTRGSFKPRLKLASLGQRGVALHEEMVCCFISFAQSFTFSPLDELLDVLRFRWTSVELC